MIVPSSLRLPALLVFSSVLQAAGLPPGVFVDIDTVNTTASGGSPAPFFTDSPADPGFTSGPLWRRRAGFGFDTAGNREVFEKDANGGVGDAAPLVTTVAGLLPGATYPVYVAYLSSPNEAWQVQAGLAADKLTLFTPTQPADRVTDLGLSGEQNSNRHQYLGLIGEAVAGPDGTLRLYSDDGDGTARNWSARSWLEGFHIGQPTAVPNPGDSVSIAPDGAWTWFNDERAIVHEGALYAGYVKAGGQYGVTRRDFADGALYHMTLSTSASAQKDDHNNPSLTVLPDGRLLALYSKHIAGSQYYQRTSLVPQPKTDADWGPEIVRPTPAANTYANTYLLSGEGNRLYNFHRCLNFNPTLSVSDDLGATWKPARQLIGTGTGGTRPYIRLASNHQDRIDITYTDGHPRDVANSLYHLYYQAGALHRSDGSILKSLADLPLAHDAGERGSVIYRYRAENWGPNDGPDDWIPTGRAWNWDVHQGRDGRPVCAFQVQRDNVTGTGWNHDRIFYYYARWTGTTWQKRFIAHAGRPLYAAEDDYGGGMALDPVDPRVVYISSNAADPFNLTDTANIPLRADNRYELWRGITADGGLTFTWTQLTKDSPADNLRPIVPENHGRTECLLWFHGTYHSYTNYSTRVLGRLGQPAPVVPLPLAPPEESPVPQDGPRPAGKAPLLRNPVRR